MAPLLRDYISDLKKLRYASRRRPIGKVVVLSIHDGLVCEHLSEAVLHPNFKNQMRIPLAGQRSHWALDGVLKPLLVK